jgi:hypothetical protein
MGHARKERVVLFGTDQRITSGPAAMAAASRRRQSSKRKQAGYMTTPERFAKRSDSFPLHRGRRPYMTRSCQSTANFAVVHNGPHDVVVYGRRPMGGLGETASRFNS